MTAIPGVATPAGTMAFATRSGLPAVCFRTMAGGLHASSVGLGTYLGPLDARTDQLLEAAVKAFLAGGVNVLDTASVYRWMLSERAIGRALRAAVAAGSVRREEVVLATKGGYLAVDASAASDPAGYLQRTFFDARVMDRADVVEDCHCVAPGFLAHQLQQSLTHLGVAAVDVYFVHNPETQLAELPRAEFLRRMEQAFALLEARAREGRLQLYGIATWSGLRVPPEHRDHVPLEDLVRAAERAGGRAHRFRVIQLPLNLAMPEALTAPTQRVDGRAMPCLQAAAQLGLSVWTSASIQQGGVLAHQSARVVKSFPDRGSPLERALEFTRSCPGVATALLGAKQPDHVQEALALARKAPSGAAAVRELFPG